MRDEHTEFIGEAVTASWRIYCSPQDEETSLLRDRMFVGDLVNAFMKDNNYQINKEFDNNTGEASFILFDKTAKTGWWTVGNMVGYFLTYNEENNRWYAKYL